MGDLTRKLAGEPKIRGSRFGPATNRCLGRDSVKGRIHFDGREMACIKFEPVRFWQTARVKHTAPLVKAPCARADAYFLLVKQIQMEPRKYSVLSIGKDATLEEQIALKI
jgi:hypothetical protein